MLQIDLSTYSTRLRILQPNLDPRVAREQNRSYAHEQPKSSDWPLRTTMCAEGDWWIQLSTTNAAYGSNGLFIEVRFEKSKPG